MCFFAFLGFIFGLYRIIYKLFITPHVMMGYSSIIALVTFFGGLILMALEMIGEYIGRIFISLNNSPLYVIKGSANLDN